ncbi:LAME_0H20340g1_1 [Lachancea meyersii CBS 8951]|uniref:Increased recombination centers protein 6 n=1 Tax=Lachancea meyersii CBS 8951 TaxID=1266667 RepID=A0A1G4KJD5_9SACH|nr:LAME_0H20340g1_1 [Lachancea meyersii CBS 8951]
MSSENGAAELACPRRTKILVAFHNEVPRKDEFLAKIFDLKTSNDTQIHRDIKWSTKYYSVSIDIYVDYFDELKRWVDEFCSPEFEELRQVLAGCIFIGPCRDDGDIAAISQLGQSGAMDWGFVAVLATEIGVNEQRQASLEQDLLANGVEITTVDSAQTSQKNEYGELGGIDRIKELIDTFEWHPELLHRTHTREETSSSSSTTSAPKMALEDVMEKLHEARVKFQEMESSEERESFAREMASEISQLL